VAPLSFLFSFYYRVFLSSHGLNSLTFFKRKKGKYHPNNACVSNKNFNKLSIVLSKIKNNTTVVYNSYFLELFFILLVAISGAF